MPVVMATASPTPGKGVTPHRIGWQKRELDNGPVQRCGQSSIAYGSHMLVFGGQSTGKVYHDDLWALDTTSMQWVHLSTSNSPHPSARAGHSACLVGHAMYIFGGYGPDGVLSDLWEYSFEKHSWSEIKLADDVPAPSGRVHHACVAIGSLMLLYGGADKFSGAQTSYQDTWIFDAKGQAWQMVGNGEGTTRGKGSKGSKSTPAFSPPGTHGHTLTVVGDKVYMFGGGLSTQRSDIYVFGVDTLTWERLDVGGLHPRPRVFHSAVALEHLIIVYGGLSQRPMSDLWEFNTVSQSWSKWSLSAALKNAEPGQLNSILKPSARVKHSACLFNNKMLVLGGVSDATYHDGVWCLSTGIAGRLRPTTLGSASTSDAGSSPPAAEGKTKNSKRKTGDTTRTPAPVSQPRVRIDSGSAARRTVRSSPKDSPVSAALGGSHAASPPVANNSREMRDYMRTEMAKMKDVVRSVNDATLSMVAEDKSELDTAIEQLKGMYNAVMSRLALEKESRRTFEGESKDQWTKLQSQFDRQSTDVHEVVAQSVGSKSQLKLMDDKITKLMKETARQVESIQGRSDSQTMELSQRLDTLSRNTQVMSERTEGTILEVRGSIDKVRDELDTRASKLERGVATSLLELGSVQDSNKKALQSLDLRQKAFEDTHKESVADLRERDDTLLQEITKTAKDSKESSRRILEQVDDNSSTVKDLRVTISKIEGRLDALKGEQTRVHKFVDQVSQSTEVKIQTLAAQLRGEMGAGQQETGRQLEALKHEIREGMEKDISQLQGKVGSVEDTLLAQKESQEQYLTETRSLVLESLNQVKDKFHSQIGGVKDTLEKRLQSRASDMDAAIAAERQMWVDKINTIQKAGAQDHQRVLTALSDLHERVASSQAAVIDKQTGFEIAQSEEKMRVDVAIKSMSSTLESMAVRLLALEDKILDAATKKETEEADKKQQHRLEKDMSDMAIKHDDQVNRIKARVEAEVDEHNQSLEKIKTDLDDLQIASESHSQLDAVVSSHAARHSLSPAVNRSGPTAGNAENGAGEEGEESSATSTTAVDPQVCTVPADGESAVRVDSANTPQVNATAVTDATCASPAGEAKSGGAPPTPSPALAPVPVTLGYPSPVLPGTPNNSVLQTMSSPYGTMVNSPYMGVVPSPAVPINGDSPAAPPTPAGGQAPARGPSPVRATASAGHVPHAQVTSSSPGAAGAATPVRASPSWRNHARRFQATRSQSAVTSPSAVPSGGGGGGGGGESSPTATAQ